MRKDLESLSQRRDRIPRERPALAEWRRLRRDVVASLIESGATIAAMQRSFVAAIRRGEQASAPPTDEVVRSYRDRVTLLREIDAIILALTDT